MPRLPLKEYAALVCQAVGEYAYPAVTVTFEGDGDDEIIKPHHHDNPDGMSMVEKHIRDLLCSSDLAAVRDGLSNVLYWGSASSAGLGEFWVQEFRRHVAVDDPKALKKLCGFAKHVAGQIGTPCCERLLGIKALKLPKFGGMSFATKILMFLDPAHCPVLDSKIARAFAEPRPPLQKLVLPKFIGITPGNAAAYESWACWCKAIADAVNDEPAPPRDDLRAVDVERALFTLVGKRDAGATEAERQLRQLRRGPAGLEGSGLTV